MSNSIHIPSHFQRTAGAPAKGVPYAAGDGAPHSPGAVVPHTAGDGAPHRLENGAPRAGIPRYLPINVYLGETIDGSTGNPRALQTGAQSPGYQNPGKSNPGNPYPDNPVSRNRSAKAATQKSERKTKRFTARKAAKGTLTLMMLTCLVAGAWFIFQVARLNQNLPALPATPAATLAEASIILAADGSELGTLFGERRLWVPLEDVSPLFTDALIAVEDHRFEEHTGVDWVRMAGAFWSTVTGDPEGASTIPMQLARNYFPELKQLSLFDRKVTEVLLARRLSETKSKDEVLEWYINTVPFGQNSFGIEAASQRFFSTTSADLQLHEAALLVGILKGSTRYNPLRNPEMSRSRRNTVLARMQDLGYLSTVQASEAKDRPIDLDPSFYDPAESAAPYFLDYVRREAESWARRAGFDLKADGLIIHTSLHPELQKLAEDAVERQTEVLQQVLLGEFGAPGSVRNERYWRLKRSVEEDLARKTDVYRTLRESGKTDYDAVLAVRSDASLMRDLRTAATQLQAGLVVMAPGSGQVLAWVGGHDYRTDQFDKVASARRQPGSIFKPILYARALEDGYSPYYLVEDQIRTFITNTRGERWTPTNSGGGASGRLVTLEQGLAWSKNTVSAHLIDRIGPQDVIDLAREMGITSPLMPVPSLALGTSETTLLEMVNAYATLADYGVKRRVTTITSISDKAGNIIATFPSEPDRVLSEQTAYTMISMLRKAVDQGTGTMLRTRFGVRGDIAGKTGTTQNNADGWFVAMHPDVVVGAWVGFNDPRISFESNYWGQGGHNALLLVGDFLRNGMRGPGALIPGSRFKRPDGYRQPRRPIYSSPPADVNVAAIGGELREPFESDDFTAPVRSPVTIPTRTSDSRIRTLSTTSRPGS